MSTHVPRTRTYIQESIVVSSDGHFVAMFWWSDTSKERSSGCIVDTDEGLLSAKLVIPPDSLCCVWSRCSQYLAVLHCSFTRDSYLHITIHSAYQVSGASTVAARLPSLVSGGKLILIEELLNFNKWQMVWGSDICKIVVISWRGGIDPYSADAQYTHNVLSVVLDLSVPPEVQALQRT